MSAVTQMDAPPVDAPPVYGSDISGRTSPAPSYGSHPRSMLERTASIKAIRQDWIELNERARSQEMSQAALSGRAQPISLANRIVTTLWLAISSLAVGAIFGAGIAAIAGIGFIAPWLIASAVLFTIAAYQYNKYPESL